SVDDAPERDGAGAEVGTAAMVLEAGQDSRSLAEADLDRDVADQAWTGLADGLEVGDAESGNRAVPELVAMAEQLVAAADGQHRGAVLHRGGDGIALAAQHVLGHESLVAVLAAADVDQVVLGGVEAVSGAGGRVAEADAAPLAATLEEDHVAPVRVD